MKIKTIPRNAINITDLLEITEKGRKLFFMYIDHDEYEGEDKICTVPLSPVTPIYHVVRWLKGEEELIEIIQYEEEKNE